LVELTAPLSKRVIKAVEDEPREITRSASIDEVVCRKMTRDRLCYFVPHDLAAGFDASKKQINAIFKRIRNGQTQTSTQTLAYANQQVEDTPILSSDIYQWERRMENQQDAVNGDPRSNENIYGKWWSRFGSIEILQTL
jgi:hypothetical protein